VTLSILIACATAYVALSLAARLSLLHRGAWLGWWSLGTLILGLGIWAMHFVGMLALHLGMPMAYQFWPTVLSVLPALLASGLVLQVASRPQLSRTALLTSSIVMASGIVGMHYLGMNAVDHPFELAFNPDLVALSVVIAIAASAAALFLAFSLKRPAPAEEKKTTRILWPVRQLLASLFLGLGIASMHYTGMWATTFSAPPMSMPMGQGAHQSVLAITVSVAMFALFGLLATALVIERHFARQQQQRDQLEGLVQARTVELENALERNQQIYHTSLAAAERSHQILNTLTEGVTQLDSTGTIMSCNASAARLLGLQIEDILGKRLQDISLALEDEHGHSTPQEVLLQRFFDRPTTVQIVGRQRRDGTQQWLSVTRHDLHTDGTEQMVICMADVTDQRENERQLQHQAHTDALTGLANRHTLYECLPELIYNATWTRTSVAVLFIDLDQFKAINDSVGHEVGDAVLVEVGRRLSSLIRPPDLLVRLGGDEFCVVLDGVSNLDDVTQVANRLHQRLMEPILHEGHQFQVGASIGVSMFPELADSSESLLRQADLAMYRVKRHGRGETTVFRPEIEAETLRQAVIERHLRTAIVQGELSLVYQPLFSLTKERIESCEVLLRWNSAELGAVSPAEFIPIAEQSGLIYQLDEWVIRQACKQAARWTVQGHQIEMAVNISALHVQRMDLVPFVERVLEETGMSPGQLRLELTEGALMLDIEAALRQLHALRQLGVQLALDDFGTGYSSLSWLQNLPIGQLKLDRSLLKNATEEPRREMVLASFVTLAQMLGMTVVTEGIETLDQLALLRRLGCDFGQGYLLSRPLSPAALRTLLEETDPNTAAPDARPLVSAGIRSS